MLVLYLIESEVVPARYSFKQSIELLIFDYHINKYRNPEHNIRVNNTQNIANCFCKKKHKTEIKNKHHKSPPIYLHK